MLSTLGCVMFNRRVYQSDKIWHVLKFLLITQKKKKRRQLPCFNGVLFFKDAEIKRMQVLTHQWNHKALRELQEESSKYCILGLQWSLGLYTLRKITNNIHNNITSLNSSWVLSKSNFYRREKDRNEVNTPKLHRLTQLHKG